MGKAIEKAWALVKHYFLVVTLPTLVVGSIYADLRHTRLWKKSLQEATAQNTVKL